MISAIIDAVDFWSEVERLCAELSRMSYFDLLGVKPEDAGIGSTLTDAYHAALRRFHPDRHAVGGTADQKEQLARLCARIGEAYRGLSSPAKRAAYREQLASGGATRARRNRVTLRETRDPKGEKARSLLESALELADGGSVSAALAKIDLALQFEPDSSVLRRKREELTAPEPEPEPESKAAIAQEGER